MQLVVEIEPNLRGSTRFASAMEHRITELFGSAVEAKSAHDQHNAAYKPVGSRWERILCQAFSDVTRELECLPSEARNIKYKVLFKEPQQT